MHGFDLLDHDPVAEDITFRDLISAAGNGSDGQDKRERGAAARLAGAELPGGVASEYAVSGPPGVK